MHMDKQKDTRLTTFEGLVIVACLAGALILVYQLGRYHERLTIYAPLEQLAG